MAGHRDPRVSEQDTEANSGTYGCMSRKDYLGVSYVQSVFSLLKTKTLAINEEDSVLTCSIRDFGTTGTVQEVQGPCSLESIEHCYFLCSIMQTL